MQNAIKRINYIFRAKGATVSLPPFYQISIIIMRSFLLFFSLVGLAAVQNVLLAQEASKYDHKEAFAPIFYPAYGDDVRTASGSPGPKYWQNAADYKINAALDDVNHEITGTVQI